MKKCKEYKGLIIFIPGNNSKELVNHLNNLNIEIQDQYKRYEGIPFDNMILPGEYEYDFIKESFEYMNEWVESIINEKNQRMSY